MSLGDFRNSDTTPMNGSGTTELSETRGGASFPPPRGRKKNHQRVISPKQIQKYSSISTWPQQKKCVLRVIMLKSSDVCPPPCRGVRPSLKFWFQKFHILSKQAKPPIILIPKPQTEKLIIHYFFHSFSVFLHRLVAFSVVALYTYNVSPWIDRPCLSFLQWKRGKEI